MSFAAVSASYLIVYEFTIITYTISVYDTLMGGVAVELESIGKNIRKYRLMKKLRQEDLAEKAGLSINYVGAKLQQRQTMQQVTVQQPLHFLHRHSFTRA